MIKFNHCFILFIYCFLGYFIPIYSDDDSYNRKEWKHWIDADRDCQNTRDEVLIRDSIEPVVFKNSRGCKILSGKWICPYTGVEITDPKKIDIDHMVPLKEASDSGAESWSAEQKRDFANNLRYNNHLLAVAKSANRQKGAKDPSEWMPQYNQCEYINAWITIKKTYNLNMDFKEQNVINNYLKRCKK